MDPNEEWFLAHMAKHPELARAGITMEEVRQATYAVSVVNWSANTTVVFESRRHAAALLATEALLAAAKVRARPEPKTIDGTLEKQALPTPPRQITWGNMLTWAEQEMWDGYRGNRSRSYRHGFQSGRDDLAFKLSAPIAVRLKQADEALAADMDGR